MQAANSDGLINWLRQPGLLLNQLQKSMREKYNPLIKFCCTGTVPAAEIKSIGLPSDALVPCFCSLSGLFYHDQKLIPITRTWNCQDSFIVTSKCTSTYRSR